MISDAGLKLGESETFQCVALYNGTENVEGDKTEMVNNGTGGSTVLVPGMELRESFLATGKGRGLDGVPSGDHNIIFGQVLGRTSGSCAVKIPLLGRNPVSTNPPQPISRVKLVI